MISHRILASVFACLVCGLACLSAVAAEAVGSGQNLRAARSVPPSAAPSAAPAESYESRPVAFAGEGRRQARAGDNARGNSFSLPSLMPVIFFVLVVCGLFVAALCLAKKYLPGHRQLFSHPAMEVLGRTHLDQRRYVSLVRVGKRIIVVGVSQDEMRALSEITDDEEITGIMEVARPKTEAGLSIFQRLFQRSVADQQKAEHEEMARLKAEELAEKMSSLRERVKAIHESEEPARQLDSIA